MWIALIILPFYNIEGKGFNLHMRGEERVRNEINEVSLNYEIDKETLILNTDEEEGDK